MQTRQWAIVLAVCIFILVPGINHGIWRPDEPQVAGICSEMARTGDWVVPRLNGRPFLEKPPLYYAVAALSGRVFGVDQDLPYRAVSLLFGSLTILVTFLIARQRGGNAMGVVSAAILASAWEFFISMRWIQVDSALVFGVTLAFFAYLRLTQAPKQGNAILLGLALGLSFLAKGMVGPAIIAAGILADVIIKRDLSLVIKIKPLTVLICCCLPMAVWVIGLWQNGGWPFVREVLVVNNLMRFTGAPEGAALGHQHGLLYYLASFPRSFLPWTILFIPALVFSWKERRQNLYLAWFLGPFILLTLASTKRSIYLVPLYPAAACMIGHYLQAGTKARWEDVFLKITWGVVITGALAPWAGIFLGFPLIGIGMGIVALGGLILIAKDTSLRHSGLNISLSMCVAMCACMSVYFVYLQPQEDYLPFSEVALKKAGAAEITVLSPDEIFEGLLPMLTGKTYATVAKPSGVKSAGLYIWADKRDEILHEAKRKGRLVEILLEQKIGSKKARLAHITP